MYFLMSLLDYNADLMLFVVHVRQSFRVHPSRWVSYTLEDTVWEVQGQWVGNLTTLARPSCCGWKLDPRFKWPEGVWSGKAPWWAHLPGHPGPGCCRWRRVVGAL